MNRADRTTKTLLALLVIGVWGLLARLLIPSAAAHAPQFASFDEITVNRINVVEADGKRRIVISNAERMPNPIIDSKEYSRSIKPAGVIFYNDAGNEVGGLVLNNSRGVEANSLILDYTRSPTDGISFSKGEDANGNFEAGISIADRRPLRPGTNSLCPKRISISGANHAAHV